MKHRKQVIKTKYLLAGGTVLAAAGFLINPQVTFQSQAPKDICQEIVQPKALLSREQLSRLLTLPERANQAQVRAIVKEPYCKLPSLEVRQGVRASREAYPLAFDTPTWLVILYEEEEYAGYAFSFQH